MIELEHVHCRVRVEGKIVTALEDETGVIPPGRYVLLSHDARIRSEMINLLNGTSPPAEGKVKVKGRPSWPIGRVTHFRTELNGFQTINFFSAIYSLEAQRVRDFIMDICALGSRMNEKLIRWPAFDMMKFTLAMGLLQRFDIIFVDGSVLYPEARFQTRWFEAFQQMAEDATLIMSTGQEQSVRQLCDRAIVVDQQRLFLTSDLGGALARFPLFQLPRSSEDAESEEADEEIV